MSNALIPEDLHHVLSRLPRDVVKMMKEHPWLYLAGGFIRSTIAGEHVSDIDLFGPSKDMLKVMAQLFSADRCARFHDTDNAFTVLTPGRTPIQFIHRWTYNSADQLILDFDYSIAQAVIWWQPGSVDGVWKSLVSEYYYADLASKRLRYLSPTRTEDAGGSLLRMRKFLGRGYHIEANSLGSLVARLAMGVTQIKEAVSARTENGPGGEEFLSKVLTGLLREVDPLRVVDGLELVDEHESQI